MAKLIHCLFFTLILGINSSFALTWDEPWADKVIKESTSFILGKIISNDPVKGIRVQVLNNLGGEEVTDTLVINKFYSLTICSSSGGQRPEFETIPIDSCYFFIQKNSNGGYSIATPSTGFDYAENGTVSATYRHSYHQASVPVVMYENTMTAIFNLYHKKEYNKSYITNFVIETLSLAPAGFEEGEINTFFLQHAALECIYHLKLNIDESYVLPFLHDKKNFHNQVSAARAMRAINSESNKNELLKAISDTTKRNFVRVMCIWSLAELNPTKFKKQLKKIEKSASDESDGFGGNIMDHRVCTNIPTLKNALKELLEKIK